LTNLFKTSSFAKIREFIGLSRLKALRRRPGRLTALVLTAAILTNSLSCDAVAKPRREATLTGVGVGAKTTLVVVTLATTAALIGVGVYALMQHAHTVKGCASDDPNGLQLHTKDGKTYVLLGATTDIRADQMIKVTGSKRKRVKGVTDQPSFVVEKLDNVYGSCPIVSSQP